MNTGPGAFVGKEEGTATVPHGAQNPLCQANAAPDGASCQQRQALPFFSNETLKKVVFASRHSSQVHLLRNPQHAAEASQGATLTLHVGLTHHCGSSLFTSWCEHGRLFRPGVTRRATINSLASSVYEQLVYLRVLQIRRGLSGNGLCHNLASGVQRTGGTRSPPQVPAARRHVFGPQGLVQAACRGGQAKRDHHLH